MGEGACGSTPYGVRGGLPQARSGKSGRQRRLSAQWTLAPVQRRRAQTPSGMLERGLDGKVGSPGAGPLGVLWPWRLPAPLTLLAAGPGGSVTQRMRRHPGALLSRLRPGSWGTAELLVSTNSCPGGPTVFPSPSLSQLRRVDEPGEFYCGFNLHSLSQEIGENKASTCKVNFFKGKISF